MIPMVLSSLIESPSKKMPSTLYGPECAQGVQCLMIFCGPRTCLSNVPMALCDPMELPLPYMSSGYYISLATIFEHPVIVILF
jgi:hypothetical protein